MTEVHRLLLWVWLEALLASGVGPVRGQLQKMSNHHSETPRSRGWNYSILPTASNHVPRILIGELG